MKKANPNRKIQRNSKIEMVRKMYESGFKVLDIAFTIHTSPQNVYDYIYKYDLKRKPEPPMENPLDK